MGSLNLVPVTPEDYRAIAEKKLPRVFFDYLDGGAYNEATLRRNVSDFSKVKFKQKVMVDVSDIDSSVEVFGRKCAMPVGLAPIGMGGMYNRRAELMAKRAADMAGVPFTLSTVSICSLEEVAKVSAIPFWFQLYMLKDRDAVINMLERAKAVGVTTLLFTVDLAVVGARYRDVRNGMSGGTSTWGKLRSGLLSYLGHPGWLYNVAIKGKPLVFGNLAEYVPKASTPVDFKSWIDGQLDPSVTWKDIDWLRSVWNGNLVIKGVLSSHDAKAAVRAGADAVIVSNHGGRQLDDVSSSISVLPEIVDAIGGKAPVWMDGGVRSGLDVVKAAALGAKMTLIGRPWVYAAAARGEAGISALLSSMLGEMQTAQGLTGTPKIAEIDRSVLY